MREQPIMKTPGTILLFILLLGTIACTQGNRETLTLTGSSTVAPPLADIAADFEAAHDGVRVDVQTGGSSRGLADVRRGTADLGMASRELRAEESDLSAHVISRDGISLLVHASNPLQSLSVDDVGRLFRGEVTNWRELTNFDAPVTIVHKGDGRATQDVFLAYFRLQSRDIKAHLIVGENQQGIRSVAGNPGAIGYVSIGAALHEMAQGTAIRTVSIDGISPTAEAVAQGDYPLTRNLYIVSDGPLEGLAADFVQFVRSPQGQQRLREHFFVPVAASDGPPAELPDASPPDSRRQNRPPQATP